MSDISLVHNVIPIFVKHVCILGTVNGHCGLNPENMVNEVITRIPIYTILPQRR